MNFKKLTIPKKATMYIILGSIVLSLIAMFFANNMIKNKAKREVIQVIKNLKVDKAGMFRGTKIEFDDVECTFNKCRIINARLSNDNFDLATANVEVIINIYNRTNFKIIINNLDPSNVTKDAFFYSYTDDVYKKIGDSMYKSLFPMNLEFDINAKTKYNMIEKSTEAIGVYKIFAENSFVKLNLESDFYFLDKVHDEKIEIARFNEENGEEEVYELVLDKLPHKSITNSFKAKIENKNIHNFGYIVYSLLANNEKANNKLLEMNSYFLGVNKDEILEQKEFEDNFLKMFNAYYNSIEDNEVAFKKILKKWENLLKKETNIFEIEAINKKGISNIALEVVMQSDGLDTTNNYLDNAFEFKY